jgi:DNA-binding LytR/AlgR family response regulator
MQSSAAISQNSFGNNYLPYIETNETIKERKPFFGIGKTSFLVYHRNKYITVPTESIALFYIKFEATVIVTFDKQEYSVNYSLEQIQQLLSEQQFYRVNRQYLINFNAIKEVEHYFARKLLVVPTVLFNDKLIVSKEKARTFLDWLENR